MYHVYWNKHSEIVKGHIFIKTKDISPQEQRHVLREELTQVLGLGKDSDLYEDSIFRLSYSTVTEYAPIDRDLIRLLYHPLMPPGLTSDKVESTITEILSSESELY